MFFVEKQWPKVCITQKNSIRAQDGSNPFVTQAVEVFQRFYPDVAGICSSEMMVNLYTVGFIWTWKIHEIHKSMVVSFFRRMMSDRYDSVLGAIRNEGWKGAIPPVGESEFPPGHQI